MALTETPVTGQECFAYRNTGSYSSPTWTAIPKAKDVSISLSAGEVETNSRGSSWKLSRQGLKELSISMGYATKQGTDAVFDALRAAFFNGTDVEFLFLDGAATETGAQGIRAFCQIFSNTINEGLEDARTADFEMKPCYHEESAAHVDPTWYTAS